MITNKRQCQLRKLNKLAKTKNGFKKRQNIQKRLMTLNKKLLKTSFKNYRLNKKKNKNLVKNKMQKIFQLEKNHLRLCI